jgi:hypothetical protein
MKDAPAAHPDCATASLATLVLPEALRLRRDHVLPPEARGPGYDAAYDATTLFYDALYLPERGLVRLFCPKLMNLEWVMRRARLAIDGRKARIGRIRHRGHYDLVDIVAPADPRRLAVAIGDWGAEIAISRRETAFDGLNCLLTVSRDNELDWIADWARFAVACHGAEGVVIFDNASRIYTPEAMVAALARIPGLRAVRVVPVDRPYGAIGRTRHRHRGKFLQVSLLNVARERFLASAQAVLVTDVDELVVGPGSIFDVAASRRSGYVLIEGEWHFTGPLPSDRLPRHADHVHRAERPLGSPRKYCVAPARAGRRSWRAHTVGGFLLPSRHLAREHRLVHCHMISTFWKGGRTAREPDSLTAPDPGLVDVFARVFGPQPVPDSRLQADRTGSIMQDNDTGSGGDAAGGPEPDREGAPRGARISRIPQTR